MKTIANATAFLVALSLMIGLILAQQNYQNSWREATIQSLASYGSQTVATGPDRGYKVVMK